MNNKNIYDFRGYVIYFIIAIIAIIFEIHRIFNGGDLIICIMTIILFCLLILVIIKEAKIVDNHTTQAPDGQQTITIKLLNGYKLVCEQNCDPLYSQEIIVGILGPDNLWHQDLVVIRNKYEYNTEDIPIFIDDLFEILVYSDKNNEDYTHSFLVELTEEK